MNNNKNKTYVILLLIIVAVLAVSLVSSILTGKKDRDIVESNGAISQEGIDKDTTKDIAANKEDNSDDLEGLFFNGSEDDLDKIINNGKPTLMSFGTKTCIYCEELKPILGELKKENEGMDILYIDIDKNKDVAYNWPIQVTPSTVVLTKDGGPIQVDEEIFIRYGVDGFSSQPGGEVEISAFFGLKQKEDLQKIIDELLLVEN